MNKPIISILGFGCDEPLVLESCEVAWLDSETGGPDGFEYDECECGWIRWKQPIHSGQEENFWRDEDVFAVYESALRDAVLELVERRHGKVEMYFWPGRRSPVHLSIYDHTGFGLAGNPHGGPTPLHAWRAASKHLKVGPWASPEKETS